MNTHLAELFRRWKKEKSVPPEAKPEEARKPSAPVPEQDVVYAAGIACAGQSQEKER